MEESGRRELLEGTEVSDSFFHQRADTGTRETEGVCPK